MLKIPLHPSMLNRLAARKKNMKLKLIAKVVEKFKIMDPVAPLHLDSRTNGLKTVKILLIIGMSKGPLRTARLQYVLVLGFLKALHVKA